MVARAAVEGLVAAGRLDLHHLQQQQPCRQSKMFKGSILEWLVDMGLIGEGEPVCYIGGTKDDKKVLQTGKAMRTGIQCSCCNEIFSMSAFEGHSKSRVHNPSARIFVGHRALLSIADCRALAASMESFVDSTGAHRLLAAIARRRHSSNGRNGRSQVIALSQCTTSSSSSSSNTSSSRVNAGLLDSDSSDAGVAVGRCDHNCDRLYAAEAYGFPPGFEVPRPAVAAQDTDDEVCGICYDGGDLICCESCSSVYHSACLGLTLIPEQFFCTICCCNGCGSPDTSVPLYRCGQCSLAYHADCVAEPFFDDDGFFFCNIGCKVLRDNICSVLGSYFDAGYADRGYTTWSLLNSWCSDPGSRAGRKEALELLKQSFNPVIEYGAYGVDYLQSMIENRPSQHRRLDFTNFFTLVLRRGKRVVCAALLRIHGTYVAELPFIATKAEHKLKGYCRKVMSTIQEMLCSWNVRKLVLLSSSQTLNFWKTKFGFQTLGEETRAEMRPFSIVYLQESEFLEKSLLRNEEYVYYGGLVDVAPVYAEDPEVNNPSSTVDVTVLDPARMMDSAEEAPVTMVGLPVTVDPPVMMVALPVTVDAPATTTVSSDGPVSMVASSDPPPVTTIVAADRTPLPAAASAAASDVVKSTTTATTTTTTTTAIRCYSRRRKG